ncbi:MAG: sn-glycerol-3-phosphate ABC transporter ATP-binding protein UgpC, partial [Burkholderiaceae bacterium]
MASVSLSSIQKSFGATHVIKGIDIAIGDGEFAVFVGPSGCGKSTLLRMIAGLDAPDSGTIRIGERVVNDLAPKEREVSMVFQTYALYPHMTVAANMGFGLMIAGTDASSIGSKVAAAAKMLGLDALLDRLPRQLSGGQRQRVAMGRAMVRNPKVFLFDEPLSNLDAKLRVQMRSEIRALHQRLHATSVYVTHDQVEAMTMADRIVVLRDGRVEQVGSPVELYDRPCNTFVAGFIGSPAMNLVAARVQPGGAQADVGGLFGLPHGAHASPGARVVLGLRPEHLQLQAAGAPGMACRVEVMEFTGADTLLL